MIAETKKAFESKTMWANLLAPILSWGLAVLGVVVPPEVQIAILGVLNIGLRQISSKKISSWL